jgi:YHS domain-containing protein
MRPILWLVLVLGFVVPVGVRGADAPADSKAALQQLNDFIGDWKGIGGPDRPRPDPKESWNEAISWSWRFKAGDSWLQFDVKNGKHLNRGEVRYLTAKKAYQLTAVDAKEQKLVFDGQRDAKGYLTFERTDPTTGETQQLVMNSAGDGVRFVYRYAVRPKGRTVFTKVYQVAATKEGESLAASGKKNECVVTGGTGTIAVTFMGETFYVCCSGCRDAFNEEPAKYVAAFKEKKKK